MAINFQSIARKQGEAFERDCVLALEVHGYDICGRKMNLKNVGIEVDIHVQNYHGVAMWFTCKGSLQGVRPGSKRTDTLRKAIGEAYLFSRSGEFQCSSPLMLFTSHVPDQGVGLAALRTVERSVIYDVLHPWNDSARLRWLYRADPDELEIDKDRQTLCDILINRWKIDCK